MALNNLIKKYVKNHSMAHRSPTLLRRLAGPAALGLALTFGVANFAACDNAAPTEDQTEQVDQAASGKADGFSAICKTNADCLKDEICQKKQVCLGEDICLSGVHMQFGECVPAPTDDTAKDDTAKEATDADKEAAKPQCNKDSECLDGQICNIEKKCVEDPNACMTDDDCRLDEKCQGASYCPPDALCITPSGKGRCVPNDII